MNILTTFYENIINSLGLYIEDGYIYNSEEDKTLVLDKGLPIVIPNKSHINTMYNKNNELSKVLFNPADDDVLRKGDSISLTLIKSGSKLKLIHSLHIVIGMLLKLAANKPSGKTKYEINKFLASLDEVRSGRNIKDEVDDTTVKNWIKIFENSIRDDNTPLLALFSKKASKIGDKSYNRVVTLHSPILDKLEGETKNVTINGINLRNKDIVVFRLVIKFILDELNEDNVISIGSNDNKHPALISILTLYINVAKRLNKLSKMLNYVDSVMSDEAYIELSIDADDLDDLSRFKPYVLELPNDKTISRAVHKEDTVTEELSLADRLLGNRKNERSYTDLSPEKIYERGNRYSSRKDYIPSWSETRTKPTLSEKMSRGYGRSSYGREYNSGYGDRYSSYGYGRENYYRSGYNRDIDSDRRYSTVNHIPPGRDYRF